MSPCVRSLPLFFNGYANHRDLHSFPTRRSSDLSRAGARRRQPPAGPSVSSPRGAPPGRVRRSPAGARARRSEEHTSELQSLRHLVCRLLLEKKKIKHIITTRQVETRNSTWPVTR